MSNKIEIHSKNLEGTKNWFTRFCPPEEVPHIFEYLRLLSIGRINKYRAVGVSRQIKILFNFCIFTKWLIKVNKRMEDLEMFDIETFIDDIQKDKITKCNNQPYAEASKQDVKILLKNYFAWRLGAKGAALTSWILTYMKRKTPEILKEEEVEKLYKNCISEEGRALICLLFDGGFRVEEAMNIRFEDVEEPTQDFPYYRILIRNEYSKTLERRIGLYWKYTTEALRDYLKQVISTSMKEPIFKKRYDSVRMFLHRLGKRVLHKRIHAHMFRKSSASHYASKLNRQQLCVRYGWTFSSNAVDIYISRGLSEEPVKNNMMEFDLSKVHKENQELKTRLSIIEDSHNHQMKELAEQIAQLTSWIK